MKDLAEQIAFQLRKKWRIANKCKVEIHYSDGYLSKRIGKITNLDDFSVFQDCYILFQQANKRRNRIRAILIQVSHFSMYNQQVTMFETRSDKAIILSKVLESIRIKYGFNSIQTANIFQALGTI